LSWAKTFAAVKARANVPSFTELNFIVRLLCRVITRQPNFLADFARRNGGIRRCPHG
jgi:hypothetical protein